MNIQSVRKTITHNNIRLSLFEHIEGIPRKIEFPKALPGRSSVVISPGGEERYNGKGKNDDVLLHNVNLLPREERLKKTNIMVSISSLNQCILS